MSDLNTSATAWPELPPLAAWLPTVETLHRWTQIVGKVRLQKAPLVNHWWNVALYVTTRGLTTSAMPDGERHVCIDFDFAAHRLVVGTSDGQEETFPLEPMSVAAFYRRLMDALAAVGVSAEIWPMPVEIPGELAAFPDDEEHAAYDTAAVELFWQALLHAERVFTQFRARFLGKVSPVHFFWGGFDLAVTRFSGRTAPPHPGGVPGVGDWVMHEAYSHEVSSAGFWPGIGLGEAAFYSYAYPEPKGFKKAAVEPDMAYFDPNLGEFILTYEAVRTAPDPDAALLAFLQTTYAAAADRAKWDREALER